MEWRKCQVFQNGEWIDTHIKFIQKGDTFRLFEPDGTPVKDRHGGTEFVAFKSAAPCEPEGNFSIEVLEENNE